VSVGEAYVGKYRLVKVTFAGQQSVIYECKNEKGDRFAGKTVLQEYRKDREATGLLRHEFEVGKPFDHPRVIKTYELLEYEGAPFLVMELHEGYNLKQHLTNLTHDGLAPFMQQLVLHMSEGLNYFHKQGWIHRDIKPDNFLCNDAGEVKLIDFALAEKKRSGLSALFGGKSRVQGTRSYMSPEQIRGASLDHRADIYSFGCTVYHLVSGFPPFTGVNPNDVLTKHLNSPPPPLDGANKNVTSEFARLIAKTMAKKPEQRPETMGHLLA
jgi:serine/threonine protein kinase